MSTILCKYYPISVAIKNMKHVFSTSSSSSSSSSSCASQFVAFFSLMSLNQMASVAPKLSSTYHSYPPSQLSKLPLNLLPFISTTSRNCNKITNKSYISSTPQLGKKSKKNNALVVCQATQVTVAEDSGGSSVSDDGKNWIPVVPLAALPKGERRVIIQNDESILLLWYKDEVLAIENRSPAEGAYTEGLLNAKLTQDGCIVCPSTDSTFDLRTGAVRDWYPKNPVLRALTPILRTLYIYPVKTDGENIYISLGGGASSDASAEIVFSGRAQPGATATNVNVEEVRMVVDEEAQGFGFTERNELINGKAAIIGLLCLLDFELLTGEGLLKGTGFLDFIYSASNALS